MHYTRNLVPYGTSVLLLLWKFFVGGFQKKNINRINGEFLPFLFRFNWFNFFFTFSSFKPFEVWMTFFYLLCDLFWFVEKSPQLTTTMFAHAPQTHFFGYCLPSFCSQLFSLISQHNYISRCHCNSANHQSDWKFQTIWIAHSSVHGLYSFL